MPRNFHDRSHFKGEYRDGMKSGASAQFQLGRHHTSSYYDSTGMVQYHHTSSFRQRVFVDTSVTYGYTYAYVESGQLALTVSKRVLFIWAPPKVARAFCVTFFSFGYLSPTFWLSVAMSHSIFKCQLSGSRSLNNNQI